MPSPSTVHARPTLSRRSARWHYQRRRTEREIRYITSRTRHSLRLFVLCRPQVTSHGVFRCGGLLVSISSIRCLTFIFSQNWFRSSASRSFMVRAPIFLLVWSNIFQCTGLSGIYLVLFTATTYVLLWGSKARKSIRSKHARRLLAIFVIATMVRSGFFFPSMRLSLSVARQKRLTRSIWRRISLALSLPSSSTLTPLRSSVILQRTIEFHADVREYAVRHADPSWRRASGMFVVLSVRVRI